MQDQAALCDNLSSVWVGRCAFLIDLINQPLALEKWFLVTRIQLALEDRGFLCLVFRYEPLGQYSTLSHPGMPLLSRTSAPSWDAFSVHKNSNITMYFTIFTFTNLKVLCTYYYDLKK